MSDVELVGAFGSPYSRKMRALLRYRRIPFRWILRGSGEDADLPEIPVQLIPILVFPDGHGGRKAMIDSTPMIAFLEELYPLERSVVPPDPAFAMIDALIEDYADEWLTKAMFHYRWVYPADIAKASRVLVTDRDLALPPAEVERASRAFAERQIGRLGVVGSSEDTRETIESSYRRLLELLDGCLRHGPCLWGHRPSAGDFALFGQLSQLVLFDPTSSEVAVETAPRVVSWAQWIDDLSSLEVDEPWPLPDELPSTVCALLEEIGRVYVPFLLANERALADDADRVECEIDGRRWVQRPFPYQLKCLRALRERYRSLPSGARIAVEEALVGSGCERLFES